MFAFLFRYEASKCPAVVVAEIDRSKLRNHVNVNLHEENNCVAASELAPSIEWQQQQVAAFSAVRQRVARCRMSNIFKPVPLVCYLQTKIWYSLLITYFFYFDYSLKQNMKRNGMKYFLAKVISESPHY